MTADCPLCQHPTTDHKWFGCCRTVRSGPKDRKPNYGCGCDMTPRQIRKGQ